MMCDVVREHQGQYELGYIHLKGTHTQISRLAAHMNVLYTIYKNDALYLIYWVLTVYVVFNSGE